MSAFVNTITEELACIPVPLSEDSFNPNAVLPYGLQFTHIQQSMNDFIEFLGFMNSQLRTKHIPRLESMLMSATFSAMVGEFMASAIPKYCSSLTKKSISQWTSRSCTNRLLR